MVYNIQKCDIILLRKKFCPVGALIAWYSGSHYNHTMLAVDGLNVIEMKSKGVFLTPIYKFENKFLYDIKVLRHKNLTDSNKQNITLWAYKYVGQFKSSYIGFVKTMIRFLKHQKMLNWSCCNFVNYLFTLASKEPTQEHEFTTPKHFEISDQLYEVKPIRIGRVIYYG